MAATRPGRNALIPTANARRWSAHWLGIVATVAALALGGAGVASAGGDGHHRVFKQRNLVSDIAGVARITDRNLVNPWGLAAGPSTPLWVADNGTGVSTLYSGALGRGIPAIVPLVVTIPGGAPTGIVFNPTSAFQLQPGDPNTAARFVFDSEAGQITAWSPNVPPTNTAQSKVTTPGAIYKGLAFAVVKRKGPLIYATDFHNNRIDVFNGRFAPVTLRPGAFTDPNIPAGFAPFNIQQLNGLLYVTYAKQDADAEDDVPGPGLGFVDIYDVKGHLLKRLISQGNLNAPWGLVIAPRRFGGFGGDLLVGNFGDGLINAYNPFNGRFDGQLRNRDGNPIQIDGLWALRFGNGTFAGPNDLIFSAGIGDEGHGLLGKITPKQHGGH
jgi:uncharacterized protein (TIGR03118 family)